MDNTDKMLTLWHRLLPGGQRAVLEYMTGLIEGADPDQLPDPDTDDRPPLTIRICRVNCVDMMEYLNIDIRSCEYDNHLRPAKKYVELSSRDYNTILTSVYDSRRAHRRGYYDP